jgi:hypothetical protein
LSEACSDVSNLFKADDKGAKEDAEENLKSEGSETLNQLRRSPENTPKPDNIDNFVSDAEGPLFPTASEQAS